MSCLSHKCTVSERLSSVCSPRSLNWWWPALCIWSSPPACCLTVCQDWLFPDQCALFSHWCSCCPACCWLISDQSPPSACSVPWLTYWSGDWMDNEPALSADTLTYHVQSKRVWRSLWSLLMLTLPWSLCSSCWGSRLLPPARRCRPSCVIDLFLMPGA